MMGDNDGDLEAEFDDKPKSKENVKKDEDGQKDGPEDSKNVQTDSDE